MDQKQPSAGGWQPIETAPRDGTPVIVARHMDEFGWIRGWARWAGGDGFVSGWVSYGFDPVMGELGLAHPTHWQPLPAPPAAAPEHAKVAVDRALKAAAPEVVMPEPYATLHHDDGYFTRPRGANDDGRRPFRTKVFTEAQLLAYAAAREAAERERCLRILRSVSHDNPLTVNDCIDQILSGGKA